MSRGTPTVIQLELEKDLIQRQEKRQTANRIKELEDLAEKENEELQLLRARVAELEDEVKHAAEICEQWARQVELPDCDLESVASVLRCLVQQLRSLSIAEELLILEASNA